MLNQHVIYFQFSISQLHNCHILLMSRQRFSNWRRTSDFKSTYNRPWKSREKSYKQHWPKTANKQSWYQNEEKSLHQSSVMQNNAEVQNLENPSRELKQKQDQQLKESIKTGNQDANCLTTAENNQNNDHLSSISQSFLQQIQNLDFKTFKYDELEHKLKEIVLGHISFREIYPEADSNIGNLLISDGIFHEMWGVILKKSKIKHQFWLYYQKFEKVIQKNHANFQSMFNQYNSVSERQGATNFNSTSNVLNQQRSFTSQLNLGNSQVQLKQHTKQNQDGCERTKEDSYFSRKENYVSLCNKNVQFDESGRIRLFGETQTNSRRLNAEIVCFFLNIKIVYKLDYVKITKIYQTQLTAQSQIVVLEGQVQTFSSQLQTVVLDYRPKLLLIAYGEANLGTLLRIKATYGIIQGLVVYDELIDIKRWLKANSILQDDNEL